MHDIRAIRENPEEFDAQLARRGLSPLSPEILAMDEARRTAIHAAETAKADQNAASKQVGAAKAKGDEVAQLVGQTMILDEGPQASGGHRDDREFAFFIVFTTF